MTAFFKKYKWTILYWTILLFFLLYFGPRQKKYYFDEDIRQFKTHYITPILIWTFGIIAVGLLLFWIIKTKAAKQSALWFLSTALAFAFLIFFFQDICLGIALFANRQIAKGKVVKTYHVSFMAGADHSKNNFYPYETSTGHIISDRKLINELYQPELKQNDKIALSMKIGFFGIPFSSHALDGNY